MLSAATPITAPHSLAYHKSEKIDYVVASDEIVVGSDDSCSDEPAYSEQTNPQVPLSSLKLFATLPQSYNPSKEWLDAASPLHPQFEDGTRMNDIVSEIKDGILGFAIEACHLILDSIRETDEPRHDLLFESLANNPALWRGALLAQHYGVIYFMSRSDARYIYHPLMAQHSTTADAIDTFLRSHNAAGIRAINYAVHAYITRGGLRVDYATSCVPPNAISAIGPRHVVVRGVDFHQRSAADVLAVASPMWDLHDFAHLSCATLCPDLYGNKYQTNLVRLPKPLTALVRSPGMRTALGPKISDGLVFSELLTKLFTEAVMEASEKNTNGETYASLTTKLARTLADYYLGRRSLEHLSTGQTLLLPDAISPTQLAVLVQNKSYELPASEIEQRVFMRGGPLGAKEDPLLGLSARDRAAWLAGSRSWGYFEVRNTIKHRAHKEAYRLVCSDLINRTAGRADTELLKNIRANILYEDWENGERVILWDLV